MQPKPSADTSMTALPAPRERRWEMRERPGCWGAALAFSRTASAHTAAPNAEPALKKLRRLKGFCSGLLLPKVASVCSISSPRVGGYPQCIDVRLEVRTSHSQYADKIAIRHWRNTPMRSRNTPSRFLGGSARILQRRLL